MELVGDLALILFEAGFASARAIAIRLKKPDVRPPRGRILHPGLGTPVWNELVRQMQPYLRKRGEKVKLARVLGIPRQRVNDYLHARTACADAEHALLMLCWLAARRRQRELRA